MIGTILGIVIASSLYGAGYVLFNGLDRAYDLFGFGLVVSGGEALAASLAGAGGAIAVWLGIGNVEEANPAGHTGETATRRVYQVPVIGIGVLLLGLAGYLLLQGDSGAFLSDLSVGDCFQTPAELEVATVEVVSCDEAHDEEIYATKQLPHPTDKTYPGLLAIDEAAFETCFDDFQPYVGAPYETSMLDILWFAPTSQSWADGDRLVVCSVARVDLQRLVGTARGLGR